MGYCLGGRFALGAAGTYPDQVAAAASFHSSKLATDQPESPHRLIPKIKARVYIGVAGIDPGFKESEKELLEKSLRDQQVTYELEVYPEAKHGFAVLDSHAYDREASKKHFSKLLDLFEKTFH